MNLLSPKIYEVIVDAIYNATNWTDYQVDLALRAVEAAQLTDNDLVKYMDNLEYSPIINQFAYEYADWAEVNKFVTTYQRITEEALTQRSFGGCNTDDYETWKELRNKFLKGKLTRTKRSQEWLQDDLDELDYDYE